MVTSLTMIILSVHFDVLHTFATVFRCNSKKKTVEGTKKSVILQHGILASSDDFTVNIPSQALGELIANYARNF